MAEIGALYDVVPPTDWRSARQLWFLSREGGVRVTSIEHLPLMRTAHPGDRPGRPSGLGAGLYVGVPRRIGA